MTNIDIPADLNQVDATGLAWTFLDGAHAPGLITPEAIVVTGDPDEPADAQVVDLVNQNTRTVVHLRTIPTTTGR